MANLFSWDADQFDTTSLGPIAGVGPRTTIDTTTKIQGTGSMKLEILGNNQAQMGIEPGDGPNYGSFVDGGRLYWRTWMKIDSGFLWAIADKKSKASRVKRANETAPLLWTMYLHRDKVYIGECTQCAPGGDDPSNASVAYDFNPATNAAVSNWQEYILEVKKQTALGNSDGEFALWVNAVQIGRVTGMTFRSIDGIAEVEAWGGYMCRPLPQLNGLASDGGLIWVDDVSIDDVFNSNYSTPAPPEAAMAFSGGWGQTWAL